MVRVAARPCQRRDVSAERVARVLSVADQIRLEYDFHLIPAPPAS